MPEWHQQKKNNFGVVLAAEVSAGSSDKCFNKMDKIESIEAAWKQAFR